MRMVSILPPRSIHRDVCHRRWTDLVLGTPINATLNHAPRQPRAYDDWSRDGSAAYAQTTPAASPKHEMPKPNKSGWTPDKLGWGRSNVY